MQLNLKHVKWNEFQTLGEIYDDNNLLLCNSVEHTPTALPDGIYQLTMVVDGIQHRQHIAIVASDHDRSYRKPYILALIESGTERHGEVVTLLPEEYDRFYLAVKNCYDRHETIILFVSSLYI